MGELPKESMRWDTWKYSVGCPVWNCKQWAGEVYPDKGAAKQSLPWYARHFGCVEGNSSFYGLPSLDQVKRWCEESVDGFRFSMKFPRAITHDAKLQGAELPLQRFLDILSLLLDHDRLGPSFVQLGPSFSSKHWGALQSFLERLPDRFPYAVEFRHSDWFDEGAWEERSDHLLRSLGIDRVLFDSRALNSRDVDDETEKIAQDRKPRTPFRCTSTGNRPFLRLIGLNEEQEVDPWWTEWARLVASWIQEGKHPFVFTHAPDDQFAPRLARRFHRTLRQYLPDLPELPLLCRVEASSKPTQSFLFE